MCLLFTISFNLLVIGELMRKQKYFAKINVKIVAGCKNVCIFVIQNNTICQQ